MRTDIRDERSKPGGIRRLFRNDGQGILVTTVILILIGCGNIFSATFVEAAKDGAFWGSFFVKHVMMLAVFLSIAFGVYRIDYGFWKSPFGIRLVGFVTTGLLIAVAFVGTTINGATRWILMPGGFLSLQPSEFAKLSALIWTAAVMSDMWKAGRPVRMTGAYGNLAAIGKILSVPALYALMTFLQPDLGTALLIFGFPVILVVMAGLELLAVFSAGSVMVVLLGAAVVFTPYRMDRIKALWDPWSHGQDLGYQTVQSLIAVGSGGFWGQGFGSGTAKYFYLPEAHTDFAFAVWAQETGYVGAVAVVLVVALFMLFGFRIAFNARDAFGTFLALGITLLIGVQALYNMLMVCGGVPVTGVPLPFISYGGSSLMMNCAAVAMLANIAARNRRYRMRESVYPERMSMRRETGSRFVPGE